MSVPFQFKNYKFDYVKIDLSNKNTGKSGITIDVKGVFYKDTSKYDLEFTVKVINALETKEVAKPYIEIRCLGTFEFEEASNLSEIPDFFYPNSIAIIFPYVRAYVSLVTNQSNNKPIILPTMNLTGLRETLIKNTIEI